MKGGNKTNTDLVGNDHAKRKHITGKKLKKKKKKKKGKKQLTYFKSVYKFETD
jgi:hypothetical protein